MKVTFNIRASGMINVEIPDEKIPELEAFLDARDEEGAVGPLDPEALPAFCNLSNVDFTNELEFEVEDIWWKDQVK